VQLKINGRKHWPWRAVRAVDQNGMVLDILGQQRRNQAAAAAFLRRVVDGCGHQPRVVITDTLTNWPATRPLCDACCRAFPGAEQRRHKGLNNRAEHSHRPTRRRERVLQRFTSPAHAQQFLAPFGPISDHFRPVAIFCLPLRTTSCCRPASPRGARWLGSWRLLRSGRREGDTSLCVC
jgi:putative transposase